jgi:hypothetical protein
MGQTWCTRCSFAHGGFFTDFFAHGAVPGPWKQSQKRSGHGRTLLPYFRSLHGAWCGAAMPSSAAPHPSPPQRSPNQMIRHAVWLSLHGSCSPPRRGSTPLRPRRDRLLHRHRHVGSHRRCIVHASVAPPPTTGAHVAPCQGVQHSHHGAGSACEALQPGANARAHCVPRRAHSLP